MTMTRGNDDDRPPLVLLHGLTYDSRQWGPVRRELAAIDADRQVLALDLPGHGDSPRRASYRMTEVAEVVHAQVTGAGLDTPIVVGHSVGAVVATAYAARYPVRGVVNLDQILLPGPFGVAVRQAEPTLRGPQWREVWDRMLARMGIESLPAEARELVATATDPRPDLLLGYWGEILHGSDEEVAADRFRDLRSIGERNIPYRWVASSEPRAPYLAWLTEALPEIEVTVLPGGHFPHLAEPATIARLLVTG
ncbi:alpha/beta fold hydrolase [Micromonospora sp. WMMD1155]|uniref:alpha/beta fold hydrolase n=1 Tax=Micromonospora sp. WMMD1155 TaxID=3016094 RepID=UPI00249A6F56|nr:alpha/beta fold hydrolase [Micromonospora sp. WMMD1155]WFE53573.1 alpha/beta fold hydrolase [Micromonospora sp. WMMD1155]